MTWFSFEDFDQRCCRGKAFEDFPRKVGLFSSIDFFYEKGVFFQFSRRFRRLETTPKMVLVLQNSPLHVFEPAPLFGRGHPLQHFWLLS